MYLLLADDLTGACDTGIAFTQAGLTVDVALSGLSFPFTDIPDTPQLLAINSGSRNLSSEEAFACVTAISDKVSASFAPELIYKKIDSSMRGNTGPEISALMSALEIDIAFITPAAPVLGRIVRDGSLFINGQLLNETVFAKDPLAPVASSSLLELLGNPGQAALIPLGIVNSGQQSILSKVASLVRQGYKWFVFDAITPENLETIARAGLDLNPRPLFAGSAGLAHALAPLLSREFQSVCSPGKGSVFFVCGSAHKATHSQIEKLADAGVPVFYLPHDLKIPHCKEELVQALGTSLEKGSCVLAAPVKRRDNPEDAARVSMEIAEVALAVLVKMPASVCLRLCICGGETAFYTLSHLAGIIRLLRELEPGVVESSLLDGCKKGLVAITKAGGFGDEQTLLRINNG